MSKPTNHQYLLTAREWKEVFGTDPSDASVEALIPGWRWHSARKIRTEARIPGGGAPTQMRQALDALKRTTGLPLIELQRRAVAKMLAEVEAKGRRSRIKSVDSSKIKVRSVS